MRGGSAQQHVYDHHSTVHESRQQKGKRMRRVFGISFMFIVAALNVIVALCSIESVRKSRVYFAASIHSISLTFAHSRPSSVTCKSPNTVVSTVISVGVAVTKHNFILSLLMRAVQTVASTLCSRSALQ
jgi:hypothetical protein